jgi:hypothetical protein
MEKTLKSLLFPDVSSRRGAPMGRPTIGDVVPLKVRCQKVPMVDGDYDPGGAYWGGASTPRDRLHVVFKLEDGKVVFCHVVRAETSKGAIEKAREQLGSEEPETPPTPKKKQRKARPECSLSGPKRPARRTEARAPPARHRTRSCGCTAAG